MTHVINNVPIGLNNLGRVFCDYAAGVFVQSALLVILLLVVDLLLRKRVRAVFRYFVWLLVLVKLVLPPTLSLPTGIGYWVGDHLPAASSISDRAFDVTGLERTRASAKMPQVRPARDLPDNDSSIMLADSALTPLTWQAVLFILWLVGVLAFLALLVQRVRFVRGLIAVSSPAKKELLYLLEQCRRKIGVRWVIRLRISDTIPSPAVCGFFRPTVLIPATLVENLSPERLRATLIHELAHIKRGDLWVNSVQTFLQVIYFYNPFVWFANAVIRRICEEAVDETVLVTLGGQAKNYSNTLIDIGEMAFWRADLGLRLIGVAESKKALQWRIKHMLNRPIPKSSKLGALGIIVIFTIAAVLLPMARAQKPGEKSESIASENQQKSNKSLHQAAHDGDIEQVKKLIAQGADVNTKDEEGLTALHLAARQGRKDVIELLIAKGARVNAKDKVGRTPLHYAGRHRTNDIAELLIARGADVNAKSKDGQTPLDFAAAASLKDLAELLIANGAKAYTLHSAAYIGDIAKVKSLIKERADVNPENASGGMPLYYAATGGHRDVVELLIASGANVNTKNIKGWTPLHGAAWWNGGKSVVELLIANGADVNAKTNDGRTPLLLATKKWHTEIAELLRKHGAKDGSSGRANNAGPSKSLHLAAKQKEQKKPAEKTLPGRIYAVASGEGKDGTPSTDRVNGIIAINPLTEVWEVIVPSTAVGERVKSMRLRPDGQALVYSITKNNDIRTAKLWVGDVRGRDRRPLATGKGAWPVWSPDGKHLVVRTIKDENVETCRMNGDGSNPTKISLPASERVWDWSPDGKWFVTMSGSDDQIYVMRPDGTQRRRLAKGGRGPRFSPDGRRIVYSRQQRGSLSSSLRMVDVDGRNDHEFFRQEGLVLWSHCWSPDGRHLAVAVCDLQKLPGGGMALIAGEEEAGWQKLPGGGMGLIAGDAEAQDWRIAIINVSNSRNLRELRLGGVRTFHIGSLDWR